MKGSVAWLDPGDLSRYSRDEGGLGAIAAVVLGRGFECRGPARMQRVTKGTGAHTLWWHIRYGDQEWGPGRTP